MKIYKYNFLLEKILESQKEDVKKIIRNKVLYYESFTIPKKGGVRIICGLKKDMLEPRLIQMQKQLYKRFLSKIPVSIHAKGFAMGQDYQTFLEPHIGNRYFMRIDIKDFFGSFSEELIMQSLAEYIIDKDALEDVYELCTLYGRLPQGAITSPVISNIAFRRADQRIVKYCQKIDEYEMKKNRGRDNQMCRICYTRYADDMLFSSNFFDFDNNMYFYHMISKIMKDNDFEINKQKTIISQEEISLNGYVLGDNLHLSRKKLRNLKKILYVFKNKKKEQYMLDKRKFSDFSDILRDINALGLLDRKGKKTFKNIQELIYYLSGWRSWLISVLRIGDTTKRQVRDVQKLVRRIEMVLEKLQTLEG